MTRHAAGALALSGLLISSAGPLHAQQGAAKGEWHYYGGDAGNSKYSPLDQINARNVNCLLYTSPSPRD